MSCACCLFLLKKLRRSESNSKLNAENGSRPESNYNSTRNTPVRGKKSFLDRFQTNKSAPKQKLKDNSEIFTLDSYYTQNRQYSNEAYEADEKDVEYSLDVIK